MKEEDKSLSDHEAEEFEPIVEPVDEPAPNEHIETSDTADPNLISFIAEGAPHRPDEEVVDDSLYSETHFSRDYEEDDKDTKND